MIEISLGQRIRELRDKADLSLRGLAKRIGISSPFLSDIELGRRFPSEEILAKLAGALEVSPDELKQYDTRAPIADLKRLMDSDPRRTYDSTAAGSLQPRYNGHLSAHRQHQGVFH